MQLYTHRSQLCTLLAERCEECKWEVGRMVSAAARAVVLLYSESSLKVGIRVISISVCV